MKYAVLITAFSLSFAGFSELGAKTVECYCTDKSGARVELGETRCLSVGGRIFMARCEMSQNVPMWRETSGGCVTG